MEKITSCLKLYRVDLDADDETGVRDSTMHLVDNFKDDAAPIGQVAAVLVSTLIGCLRQELCQQIAVRAMYLAPRQHPP